MIPVRLTIEGLYSYQKRQTIDFTRLTAANIFGIFGQVGSGKSSILEAITFAIYGDTERLNSKEGRGYNMMNLKSDSLLIEFEFISGIDHKRYLAAVAARRNSKRFEDVKAIDRKAFVDDNGSWCPIELGGLEQAIGLSYANFKRTIIIPQGRFQEFLQLDKKERTNMMKELFSLEKYDLFRKAASLDKRNAERRQFLEGQLSSLGDISAEQVDVLRSLCAQHAEMVKTVTLELAAKRKELEEWSRLKELNIKYQRLLADKQQLEAKSAEIALLEQQLKEYEYCMLHFKGTIEQHQQVSKNIVAVEETLRSERSSLEMLLKQLSEKSDQQLAIKADYDNRERTATEVEDLKKIVTIRKIKAEIDELRNRTSNGDRAIEATEKHIANHRQRHEELAALLKSHKDQLPDAGLLASVREWYATQKSLEMQAAEANAELEAAQNELKRINNTLADLLITEQLSTSDGMVTLQQAQELLRQAVIQSADIIRIKDKELEHLLVQQKLGQYASELHSGEPCPLCGSTHHPQMLNVTDVTEAIAAVRLAKESAEIAKERYNAIDRRLAELNISTISAEERCSATVARAARIGEQLAAHRVKFTWPDYATEEALNSAMAKLDQLASQIKSVEVDLELCAKQLKEEEANAEKYRKAVEGFKLEIASKEGQQQSLSQGLRYISVEDFADSSVENLTVLATERTDNLNAVIARFEKLTTEMASLNVQEAKVRGSIGTNEAALAKDRAAADEFQATIARKLQESSYDSLEEVMRRLALNLDVEGTRTTIMAHSQAQQAVAAQLADTVRDLGGRSYIAEQHATVEQDVAMLSEREAANRKEQGRLENEISTKSAALAQQAAIRAELDTVTLRATELGILKNMFAGNRFIDFISTTYLQNLCAAANERFFTMTRRRLSLELTEENSFQVRDFMNGGKTRSVKTLSGGQTFQASLALALALSDNIQRMQSADQNFFFLDEGFGTLDKESLGVVFDTLKSLRKENRIVGVISHVDEMQQEIDTYLSIANHEDRGSEISASWE